MAPAGGSCWSIRRRAPASLPSTTPGSPPPPDNRSTPMPCRSWPSSLPGTPWSSTRSASIGAVAWTTTPASGPSSRRGGAARTGRSRPVRARPRRRLPGTGSRHRTRIREPAGHDARLPERDSYSDDKITNVGDRLVDALVAYGDPATIAAKVREHIDAGADHVELMLSMGGDYAEGVAQLEQLAP